MDPQRFALLDEVRRGLPDGFKAEISGDTIVMMVGPSGIHQRNLLVVRRQFDVHAPGDLVPSEHTDLVSPGVGKSRNPDLTYLPAGVLETTDNQVPAETAAVAVELVSPSNPENDWVGKLRDYATGMRFSVVRGMLKVLESYAEHPALPHRPAPPSLLDVT